MVSVGDVLYLFVEDTDPPKKKYFFVLGMTENEVSIASFYVNSEINLNVNNNPVLVKYNIEINPSDYPFLSYKSYLDCTKMVIRDKKEFDEIVRNRPEAVVYKLTDIQLHHLRSIIREVPTFKGKIINKFGFYDN
ncbi:hypothetical protein [Epilithonimonas hungarica]|uniref:Uncharacterized protein n=1 Tax=Epilithonimonas hungarica TaxID=454006 RepID=A0A1G7F807_9FLAO|nr:hypothetical protein [Epilithonimonas hungarica]SDE72073.1 hypothetical protein SAMN05421825_0010 [Epilithonimonas hungarica]